MVDDVASGDAPGVEFSRCETGGELHAQLARVAGQDRAAEAARSTSSAGGTLEIGRLVASATAWHPILGVQRQPNALRERSHGHGTCRERDHSLVLAPPLGHRRSIRLPVRVSQRERLDLLASLIDALHSRIRIKVAPVEHLRAGQMCKEADIGHCGFVAITEPSSPLVAR